MLTTEEASKAIAKSMSAFDMENVTLADATGRVLRQSINAERDQPPFDRVTMDGIAVVYASLSSDSRRFAIQSTQAAGDPVQILKDGDHCIEIMTGAVMPNDADCVIPVERISVEDGIAKIEADYSATRNQFIHFQGSDHAEGTEVLAAGTTITALEVAIIASILAIPSSTLMPPGESFASRSTPNATSLHSIA